MRSQLVIIFGECFIWLAFDDLQGVELSLVKFQTFNCLSPLTFKA